MTDATRVKTPILNAILWAMEEDHWRAVRDDWKDDRSNRPILDDIELPASYVEPLRPATLGSLLRLIGVPGDSIVVAQIAKSLSSTLLVDFGCLLGAMKLSKEDDLCQLEMSKTLKIYSCGGEYSSEQTTAAVEGILACTGLSTSDQLDLVLSIESIEEGDRWRLVEKLDCWDTSTTGNVDCMKHFWRRVEVQGGREKTHLLAETAANMLLALEPYN